MERLKSINYDEFNWSDPEALRSEYKRRNFDFIFNKFIAKRVITTLSPQLVSEPHNLNYDDELIYKNLIGPLEKFICGLDESDPDDELAKILDHIKTLKQPSKLCRRVLKTGDVLFSCNDCGFDATCVVCIDCFHKSAHKDHNYRMSNTDGGGCCDCGDVEAWKQNYACSDHIAPDQATVSLSDFENPEKRSIQVQKDRSGILEKISLLPEGVATRFFLVCQASLHYARMLLSWKESHLLPENLRVDCIDDPNINAFLSTDNETNNFFTVLFNDEVHTYDHVIHTLVKIIRCTKVTASVMASTVSREGRSLIFNNTFKACTQVKESIIRVPDGGQGPLGVEVIHGTVLAHQAFALKLIEWIQRMALRCDAFRVLTAYTLLGTYDMIEGVDEPFTMIEKIMLSNTTYWKMARIDWNDLFVTTMLTEYSIKEKFARLITRIYSKLIQYFISDDHDHSVSILTMTTQLYTVPSLICMLIEEENALQIITQTLVEVCGNTKRERTVSFEQRNAYDANNLKRGFYIVSDLKHLINIRPTQWTHQLRKSVIQCVKVFLNLLSDMQGMDSVKRQQGQHLEYEPEWESGMTLQSRLITVTSRLITYCGFDEEVLVDTLKETQRLLFKDVSFKMVTKNLFGHQTSCIQYDVSTSLVSVHLPLTRFAAALMLELMQLRPHGSVPYDESLVILCDPKEGKHSMIELVEPSLRTEVMIAQFRAGMWRRNGYSLVNQIMYFHGPLMRREMFDRDILVLQEYAAMCDPEEFMIHLINKFNLFTWASSETTREPLVGHKAVSFYNDEEILTQTMNLGEEFLQLTLTIISERYRVGIGKIEEEDVMKNEIIQLLCISPYTRSDLTTKLCVSDNELDCIKTVANLKRSTDSSTGKYELKEEFYERFNPFFYHFSRRHLSQALDSQLKRKKNRKEPLICCPPPKPVELTDQFRNLNELLKCDILLTIIQKVLRRAQGPPENSQECSTKAPIRITASDLQLDQCLHLLGVGLYEQERNPIGFRFLEAAFKKDIFSLLSDCYEKAKRSRDLVYWLMQKISLLIDELEKNHSSSLDDNAQQVNAHIRECFKSTLTTVDSTKQDTTRKNSELAAQRRERVMAMMKAKQAKFLSNHDQINDNMDDDRMETESINTEEEVTHLCILCRDDQKIAFDQPTMVLLAYIQRSAVLSKNRAERRVPNYELTPSNQLKNQFICRPKTADNSSGTYSFTSDNSWSFDATFMPADLFFSPYVSTCGHAMHYECWQGFFDSVTKREASRPNRTGRHASFELERGEILCPLCECISNATIPILPDFIKYPFNSASKNISAQSMSTTQCQKDDGPSESLTSRPESLSACLHALRGTVDMLQPIRHIKGANSPITVKYEDKYMRLLQPKAINDVLEELGENEALGLRDFINSVRSEKISSSMCIKSLLTSISVLADRIHLIGLDLDKSVTDVHHGRIFMMSSWSIAYNIQAHERVARYKGQPIFQDLESIRMLCLSTMIKFVCASMMTHQSDMIQSLLVKKLRYLLINDEHLSSSPCVLDIDAFEMFVSLFVSLQKLYAHVDDMRSTSSSSKSTSIASIAQGKIEALFKSDDQSYGWTTKAYDHDYYNNLLQLMVIFNLLQVVLTMQTNEDQSVRNEQDAPSDGQDATALYDFYKEIIIASGHPNSMMPKMDARFISKVRAGLLPFLRSCAIFFCQLTRSQPPESLRKKSAFSDNMTTESDFSAVNEEFNAICLYLNLPNDFKHLLRSQEARHLARTWLRHSRVLILIESAIKENKDIKIQEQKTGNKLKRACSSSNTTELVSRTDLMPVRFIRQPHTVNRLIDLPNDYSELVDKVSDFSCPSIANEASRTPALCLVCGAMLCSKSYCCQRDLNELASNYQLTLQRQQAVASVTDSTPAEQQQQQQQQQQQPQQQASSSALPPTPLSSVIHQQLVGSCTYHAHECSAGVGVFLRIRNCEVLLLSGKSKGCYMPAPYIDDHGETDFGLMRGNPLHLNREHYERLQHMWMTHTIPEQISHTLEYSHYASNINWHIH